MVGQEQSLFRQVFSGERDFRDSVLSYLLLLQMVSLSFSIVYYSCILFSCWSGWQITWLDRI